MAKRYSNNVVLAFGDTHFPYSHRHTIEFLGDVASQFNPDRVVHLGDLLDIYSVSSYPKDPDHPDSWTKELKNGRKEVKKLAKLFPKMDVMESNHDDRAYKKSRISGIPREFIVSYNKVVDAPDGWKWHRDLTITVDSTREKLHFVHTKTGGSFFLAKDLGHTAVIGHHHTKFGATAFKPSAKKMLWGVDAGCLVSDEGSPFEYNKGQRGRPQQGCCVIVNGVPQMVPLR